MATGSHVGFDLGNIRPPTMYCTTWFRLGPQISFWSDL